MRIGANTSANAILVLNLLRKTKKNFYKALDEKQVSDSKTWKNVKPFFSDKSINSSKITLAEKNAIVVEEEKIATNIINNYFINITKNLNLKPLDKNKVDIDMFENHISIKKYMKPFLILFQRTFISKKYPKMM